MLTICCLCVGNLQQLKTRSEVGKVNGFGPPNLLHSRPRFVLSPCLFLFFPEGSVFELKNVCWSDPDLSEYLFGIKQTGVMNLLQQSYT